MAMRQKNLFRQEANTPARRWPLKPGAKAVILTDDCMLLCPKCHEYVPIELRHMGNGEVRNQPRCVKCRKL